MSDGTMTAGPDRRTRWPVITKEAGSLRVKPNLADYEAGRAAFTWDEARQALAGLPDGRGLNIAYEAVDRHAAGVGSGREALRFVRADGSTRSLSYADLATHSSRFASVLRDLGIGRGDRVFSLLGRCPELYIAVLGTFKNASVFCPLFSAFGPEPVRQRLHLGTGRVLVTTRALYRKKVAPIRDSLPDLRLVLLVVGLFLVYNISGKQNPPDKPLWPRSPRTWPCCISRAGPPAPRKAPSTFTTPSLPTTPRATSPLTCTLTTSTGVRPTRGG